MCMGDAEGDGTGCRRYEHVATDTWKSEILCELVEHILKRVFNVHCRSTNTTLNTNITNENAFFHLCMACRTAEHR